MKNLAAVTVALMMSGQVFGQVMLPPAATPTSMTMVPVSQPMGISAAAAQQSQALNASAKLNMMLGIMLLSQCMNGKSPNMMMCMLGAYALAQGMNAQQAANQAAATASATSIPVATTGTPVMVTGPTASLPPTQLPAAAVAGLKTVSTAGYTVTSEGVTDSSGKSVQMPAMTSKQDLAKFGLDQKTITQVQRTIASAPTEH